MLAEREAQDAAAVSLVRNALTAVERARIDSSGYDSLTLADLQRVEPAYVWRLADSDLVNPTSPKIFPEVTARADLNQVDYYGQSADTFDVASISASGNRFAIQVKTAGAASTTYVKAKQIEGVTVTGW